MGVVPEPRRSLLVDVPAIVEHAQARELLEQRGTDLAAELLVDGLVVLQAIGWFLRIEPVRLHPRDTGSADAIGRQDDVEEDALSLIGRGHLAGLVEHVLPVARVIEADGVPGGAQILAARRVGRQRMMVAVGGADGPPLRMFARSELIPLHRDVDRGFDIGGAERLDHVAQQIRARQMRVRLADLCRIVRPAVMALGEHGDRVDVRALQRRNKYVRIERRANPRNMLRGVKVEMYLAITKRFEGPSSHFIPLSRKSRGRRRRTDVGKPGRQ